MSQILGVQDLLIIKEFVNHPAEEIDDLDEDIMEAIIEAYSRDQEHDIAEDGGKEIQYSLSNPELVSPELSFTRKIPGKI